jgi:uncharacterized glyoxalase superfamily protein PhnB
VTGRARPNRSIPDAAVMPVLSYPDPGAAAEWLADAFGFTIRLRIFNHRVQLTFDGGALVTTDTRWTGADAAGAGHSVLVRVGDVDEVYERALAAGAIGGQPPTDFDYGERQANLTDPWGHHWTFSQTIADVDPAAWGGVPEVGADNEPGRTGG